MKTESIEDHSDEYYTGKRHSIIDRLWFINNRSEEDISYDLNSLAGCVGRAVGAVTQEEINATVFWTPADELAQLLLKIRKSIESNTEESKEKATEIINAAVELAFLHSPAYRAALKLFEIEHLHCMPAGDERSAFDAIRAHINRAVNNE